MPGRELYASPNGDVWHLQRDPETGHTFVRHTANAASGGSVTDIGLLAFLGPSRNGPEHQALWRLIATLTDGEAGPPPTQLA